MPDRETMEDHIQLKIEREDTLPAEMDETDEEDDLLQEAQEEQGDAERHFEAGVADTDVGTRLDAYLTGQMETWSRSLAARRIRDGLCTVNGKGAKPGYMLRAGDTVAWTDPAPEPPEILPEDIPLDILYEDDDLLIVNKPKGMVVHPAPGHASGTLVNAVMYHCGENLSGINGVLRPGIVHRIDRDTTGSIVICKNDRAHTGIASQLAVHSIRRTYRAIVWGNITEEEGTVDAPIGRHPTQRKKMCVNPKNGKRAVTHYRVLARLGNCTYVECTLETGRTHQIRVHLSSIGHPVVGDAVYGNGSCPVRNMTLEGQTLHAMTLGFVHPTKQTYLEVEAPLPDYFKDLLSRLGDR